jgi:hypothetical protein
MSTIADPRHRQAREMFTAHVQHREPVVMLSRKTLKDLASGVKFVQVGAVQSVIVSRAERFEAATALITER